MLFVRLEAADSEKLEKFAQLLQSLLDLRVSLDNDQRRFTYPNLLLPLH